MSSDVATYSLSLAILAFLSTTLDDFSVVLIFFGKEYVKTHNVYDANTCNAFISIIVGQIIGFTLIVGISLGIGIGLRESISSDEYIDLIGFVPILIGVYKIYQILEEEEYLLACCISLGCASPKSETDEPASLEAGEDAPLIATDKTTPLAIEEGTLTPMKNDKNDKNENENEKVAANSPKYVNLKDTSEFSKYQDGDDTVKNENEKDETEAEPTEVTVVQITGVKRGVFYCTNPLVEEVALYALLFGVDNIAIYVSLLCSLTNIEIIVALIVFYGLLVLYLGIAIAIITQFPFVGDWIGDNSKYLVPFVLIGLGTYILYSSVIWNGSSP